MDIKPVFFPSQSDLRKWFEKNHKKEKELYVGFYKTSSGKPSITWPQSVDEALCFGWIDGRRQSIDDESYFIRFSKRKPKSIWSTINIKKVAELTRLGLMKPEGIEAFNKKEEKNSGVYAYENKPVELSKEYERKLKANKKAWTFFQSQVPSYRNPATRWVMSAKQEVTRLSRLESLIKDSEAGMKIKPMRYGLKNKKQ